MNIDFENYLNHFKTRLHQIFNVENDINQLSLERGLPQSVWDSIMETNPLSVAIPSEFGGRGSSVKECLAILSAAAYESLSLSLTFGINIALFLEPLAKYGEEKLQHSIFKNFLEKKAMGGLMITEPEYGSDALNMKTEFEELSDSYRLKGKKHWQGLTGKANYWIVAAREKMKNESLSRDISFFVTENDKPEQKIEVEKYYNNLGLYMIPYGLNQIDIEIPKANKLQQKGLGIKTMLDILHRSRLQFPGMGMGFIKRMLDEAIERCSTRIVGGNPLTDLDSVRYQISRIQSAHSICSGMCARSIEISGIDQNLASHGLEANAVKAYVTDLMQESAQICAQLSGGNGYQLSHIAGRGIVDSRSFQIFEGPNEMLYSQISEMTLKQMKRKKTTNFFNYLQELPLSKKVAGYFENELQFDIKKEWTQRKQVTLGKIIARVQSFQYVVSLSEKGFREDLMENCKKHIQMDLRSLVSELLGKNNADPVIQYEENSDWMAFV